MHGDAAAKEAEAAAKEVFEKGSSAAAMPTAEIPRADLESGILVAAAFTASGLTKSNGEARRMIKQGAAKVNDKKVTDEGAVLTLENMDGDAIKLSAGKKRHALVKPA